MKRTIISILSTSLVCLFCFHQQLLAQCGSGIVAFPYVENFDVLGANGWTTGGTNNSWALGAPTKPVINAAKSAPNCFTTSLAGQYNNAEYSFLISPCINFTTIPNPQIKFDLWWECQQGMDGLRLEGSTNGGSTWFAIGAFNGPFNWYNNSAVSAFGNLAAWSGSVTPNAGGSGQWLTVQGLLTGMGGQGNCALRFVFASDGTGQDDGVAIDNIVLRNQFAISLGPDKDLCGPTTIDPGLFVGGTYSWSTGATTQTISPSTPGTYTVWVTDNLACIATDDVVLTYVPPINSFPYDETFDTPNGQNGWVASPYNGSLNTWAFGTPSKTTINSAASAPNSWVTGGLSGQYSNYEKSHVVSPCFSFSNLPNPEVKMDVVWETQFSQDGAVLQYSLNNGYTWSVVGGYNQLWNWNNDNSINAGPGDQPASTALGWSGTVTPNAWGSGGWKTAQREMLNLGGTAFLRFRVAFAADNATVDEGFAFDNFSIHPDFEINLGPDKEICGGVPLVLNPGACTNCTYQWNAFNATTPTLTVTNPGTYIVTVTNQYGYKDRDTIVVTSANMLLNLGPDTYVCPGNVLTLNSQNTSVPLHEWYNTSGTLLASTQTYNVTQTGFYVAKISNNLGCTLFDTIFVYRDSLPNMQLGNDTALCLGTNIQLNAGSGGPNTSYLWSNGATSQSLIINAPGLYVCTATSWHGCTRSDSIFISVLPTPVVNLGPDHVECAQFTLDAGNAGAMYSWNTGASAQTITSSTPGTYSVTVTNNVGCSASDAVTIYPSQAFSVSLGSDRVICGNKPVVLDPGNFGPNFTYFWSTAATSQTIGVTLPNVYYVTVTNPQGCKQSDTVNVTLSTLNVNLGPDKAICNGSNVTLYAGSNNHSYNWSTGATTPSIVVSAPGTYSVSVLDNLGCLLSDTVNVIGAGNYSTQIVAPAIGYLSTAVNFSDNPTPAGSSAAWSWDFGDGIGTATTATPAYTYQSIGNFTVSLTSTNAQGCNTTVTKVIQIKVAISIDAQELGVDFQLMPNPNDGNFHISATVEQPEPMTFEVYDISGKLQFAQYFGPTPYIDADIQTEIQESGVYILKLQKGDKSVFGKMIVK